MGFDAGMAGVAAGRGAPIILMHSVATPATMQDDPRYDDVLLDVFDALQARIAVAVAAGIARDRIMVDPGIGFGKTQAHNIALIRGISLFHDLGGAGFAGCVAQALHRQHRPRTAGRQARAGIGGGGAGRCGARRADDTSA